MDAVLQLKDLSIGYRNSRQPIRVIAQGLSAELHRGEMVCVLGPNGAGKSTLLRTLTGMQPPLKGSIRLMGRELYTFRPQELSRQISVVLTEAIQAGALPVYDLVALGRYPYTDWLGRLTEQDDKVIRWALNAAGAGSLAGRHVAELSDGERQKAMIARALAQEPAVMALDEPTAFLDLPHRAGVMRILRQLARDTGRAILLSTHDLDLALRSADRIWLMGRDGSFTSGTPEDLVLNGAFEETFRSEGIEFDRLTGSFKIEADRQQAAAVIGEGAPAEWTRRALVREGYREPEAGEEALITVEVRGNNGATHWRVTTPGAGGEQDTIESMLSFLREYGGADRCARPRRDHDSEVAAR